MIRDGKTGIPLRSWRLKNKMNDAPFFSFPVPGRFRRMGMLGLMMMGIFLMGARAGAQTVANSAALADPLENLQGSARDLSLGSAFVGVADDPSALFFNSAGL